MPDTRCLLRKRSRLYLACSPHAQIIIITITCTLGVAVIVLYVATIKNEAILVVVVCGSECEDIYT